jgi:hypothetical protein
MGKKGGRGRTQGRPFSILKRVRKLFQVTDGMAFRTRNTRIISAIRNHPVSPWAPTLKLLCVGSARTSGRILGSASIRASVA